MDSAVERVTRELLATEDAVPYGGAQLADAGGGLPARLTTAAICNVALGGNTTYCGVCWDADGAHVWHARFNSGGGNDAVRKLRVSDGTQIATVSPGGTIMSITRDSLDQLIVAGYGAKKIYVIDPVSLAVTTISPTGAPSVFEAVRDSAGNFWTINAYTGGTATEYGADGTATGRTVAGTWTGVYVHPHIPGYIYLFASSGVIKRVAISNLAELSFTVATAAYGQPGESQTPFSGCVDSTGKLYAYQALQFRVDRWPAAGGAATDVAIWPGQTYGVQGNVFIAGSMQHAPFVCFTDDDSWVAWMACTTGATVRWNAIRARCVGAQGGIWTRAAQETRAVTLKRVCFAGDDGNSGDYTPTKFYVSTNGTDWTEIQDGVEIADGAGIAIAVGAQLRVKWETTLLGVPPAGDPFCGGDEGEAVVLEIEDTGAVEYPTSGQPSSATTLTAIRTNYTTKLEALTPTLAPTKLFHNSTLKRWFEEGRGDDLRLFKLDSGRPFGGYESEDLGVCDYSCRLVREHITLRVRYPRDPHAYPDLTGGNADDAMEAVIRSDADQIADLLRSALNYVPAMLQCAPEFQIDQGSEAAKLWTLIVDCAVDYYRAQTVL